MPTFSYKGRSKDGTELTGTLEAENRFELARKLRAEGTLVLSAEVLSVKTRSFLQTPFAFFNRIKLKEKIALANNLSTMIEAGLTLSRSLAVIEKQTTNPRLKQMV